MSKKKTITYETTPPKGDSKVIRFTVDMSKVKRRNLLHLHAMQTFRSNVVESKKKKPPKYKHKIYEEE